MLLRRLLHRFECYLVVMWPITCCECYTMCALKKCPTNKLFLCILLCKYSSVPYDLKKNPIFINKISSSLLIKTSVIPRVSFTDLFPGQGFTLRDTVQSSTDKGGTFPLCVSLCVCSYMSCLSTGAPLPMMSAALEHVE